MKALYDIIDKYCPYSIELSSNAQDNLFVFQLPEYDFIDFFFYRETDEDDEIIHMGMEYPVAWSTFFRAVTEWNVVVEVGDLVPDKLWTSLVSLNKIKYAAMLAQQEMARPGFVAPYYRQFIVELPDNEASRSFIDQYTYWVGLAEELSDQAVEWMRPDEPDVLQKAGEAMLFLAYDILHRFCFGGIQFQPQWDEESCTYGPFVSYNVKKTWSTTQLFHDLIENQYGAGYIDRPLKLIEEFISEGLKMNITKTAQAGGCWNASCPPTWLEKK